MAMTAILDIIDLRTHTVSVTTHLGIGNAAELGGNCPRLPRRPALVMRWHVRPDGHLTCHWQTDIAAAFGLPPD
jgi:hypothetical protein